MEALVTSTLVVALAEIGDKTQLLALLLAARYRRFWPLALGILVATLANHAAAAWLGGWVTQWFSPEALRWALAASLFAVALWVLVPDRLDDTARADASMPRSSAWQAFTATTIAFFLAEIGDKTQIATVLLAARYDALIAVVCGTTLGMLAANLPVVWLGDHFAGRLPLRATRITAAVVFALLAIATMAGVGSGFDV